MLSVTLQLFFHASDHLASTTCLSCSSDGKSTLLFLILLWVCRSAALDILTYLQAFSIFSSTSHFISNIFLCSRCTMVQAGSVWWNENLGTINTLNPGHPNAATPYPRRQRLSCMPFYPFLPEKHFPVSLIHSV